jgi:hypothetical protein
LLKHDWLAMLLPVVVAELDDVLGTTQLVWQLAACALQSIMQFVVVELCASRIGSPASAAAALNAPPPIVSAAITIFKARISASSTAKLLHYHNAAAAAEECATDIAAEGSAAGVAACGEQRPGALQTSYAISLRG